MENPVPLPVETKYYVRYTNDCLVINNEPVNYGPQILDLDKLYIIVTGPQSQLQTPIVLERTQDVDELDRKIFFKTFLMEIVKGLEISTLDDATFILQRVPKLIKYFVGIVQKVSLARWIQLLASEAFFLVLYQTLEQVISKRQISQLRANYVEELIQAHLKAPYSRIFFLLDNLVLENENLRNSMMVLAQQIALKQIREKNFFEVHLLNKSQNFLKVEESQNERMDDNRSETDSIPEDKEMAFPQNFLRNSIQVIKSCQKIKIDKKIITNKILNSRFFKILKYFFQGFFEKQKMELLEILAMASQIEPIEMWRITFDEGRTIRCKTLLLLESLLTNSMIGYNQTLKKSKSPKKLSNQSLIKDNKNQAQVTANKNKCWQFTSVIIEKFISINSPERKVFLHKILKTLLAYRLVHEELDLLLMFLEASAKDEVYLKKNTEIWKVIVKKIEAWIVEVTKGKNKKQIESAKNGVRDKKKKTLNSSMITNQDLEVSRQEIISEQLDTSSSFTPSDQAPVCLPLSKTCIIKLLKIYKLLMVNQKKFDLQLDPYCLMYLVDVTENRKGVIEGARLALIDVLSKRESMNMINASSVDLSIDE